MSKKKIIQEYMTHLPILAKATDSLSSAQVTMRSNGIRHLPVMAGLDVVGIVSDRDIKFARAAWGDRAETLTVKDIMSEEIFEVHPLQKLGEVASAMEEKKIGSAIVKDADVVVGIFTTVDALRALRDLTL